MNISISNQTWQDILAKSQSAAPRAILTINSQLYHVLKNHSGLNIDIFDIVFDGQMPLILFRLLNPSFVGSRICGSDLMCSPQSYFDRSWTLFIIGGSKEANKSAVTELSKKGFNAAGESVTICSPPTNDELANATKIIEEHHPDVIFVCLGGGKQELFTQNILPTLPPSVKLVVGAGGGVDFLSGNNKRAPLWVQKIGFEFLYRLFDEGFSQRGGKFLQTLIGFLQLSVAILARKVILK